MKVLLLNGEGKNDDLEEQNDIIGQIFKDKGLEFESIKINDQDLKYCVGCFSCWVKTPGECIFKDEGNEIARKIINSDILILLTPVTFGGYSPDLKIMVDRFLPLILPFFSKVNGETHHSMRYDRSPIIISIGVMEEKDPEEEKIFSDLLDLNTLNFNFKDPKHLILHRRSDPKIFAKDLKDILTQVGVKN